MINPEHTKDGKVKEEYRSKYSANQIKEFGEDLTLLTEKELLIEILKELRKLRKKK